MKESARPEEPEKKANGRFAELRRERLDEIQAFGEYLQRARKVGALSAEVKELINLERALAAIGSGPKRSLPRMRTVHVSLPRGRYLSELRGEGGRGRIVVPRVWRLRACVPDWRSGDE